jgi:hypothetical protein
LLPNAASQRSSPKQRAQVKETSTVRASRRVQQAGSQRCVIAHRNNSAEVRQARAITRRASE